MYSLETVKIPFWKRWLSYLIEYELECLESDHGHELSLCLSDGRFQLNSQNAIYSWEDKYDNFYKAFDKMKWDRLSGDEFLSLGFGLGSIAQMLEKNFDKKFHYTGVELDENVIYLAEKYILHQLKSSVQIIQAPAEIFVETTEEQYNMITIDVFINDKIPEAIRNHDFLNSCNMLLAPNGLLLMNVLSNKKSEQENANLFFKKVFKKVFPEASILDVDGNYIFFSDNSFLKSS